MNRPPELPPGGIETPPDAIRQTRRETVIVGDRTFTLLIPDKSDTMIDHPGVRAVFAAEDHLPYWADLWPAARMLAKTVLREPWPADLTGPGPRPEVLELGCGLGLSGLAALARGMRVVFSDLDRTALRFAAENARLNGFADYRLLPLDWRSPPAGWRVPLILGSDLTYEVRHVEPIVTLVRTLLAPGGLCLLTDVDRVPAPVLREKLAEHGLRFTATIARAGQPDGQRFKGTLYRITHAAG